MSEMLSKKMRDTQLHSAAGTYLLVQSAGCFAFTVLVLFLAYLYAK